MREVTVEKRQVHTDALQTLGSIIGEDEKRDAIHLAVEPVVAGETLEPGDNVGRLRDGSFGIVGKPLGIVDPFLTAPVRKGQRFWLVVYPRQITALHHVWEHPDFPDGNPEATVKRVTERLTRSSETWIREEFVPKVEDYGHELTYEQVMEGAKLYLIRDGDGVCAGNDIDYDFIGANIEQFWQHYMNITGEEVPEEKRQSFFRCAC